MTSCRLATRLLEQGYEPADQLKDFGYLISTVLYAKKKVGNDWIYVSAVFDVPDGVFSTFLEAVVETYAGKPKNTRDKGCRPVSTTIVRDPYQLP